MHRIDTDGHVANEFSDGNPLTGQEATLLDAAMANAIMYEIINVILHTGAELSKGVNTQLRDAIIAIATGGGEAVTAENVSIADAGNLITGTNVETALQELAAAIANNTYASSRFRRNVIALSGASHQTDMAHLEQVLEISHSSAATYTVRPDTDVPLMPNGAAITIFQTGAGQVEIVQGSGVTVQKGASFNRKTMEQHSSLVLIKVAANTWRLSGTLEAAA